MDNGTFEIQSFILQLLAGGGSAMLVSGWLSAKWTKFTGTPMLVQTFVVSILMAALASLVGIIPISIAEFWTWFSGGLGNGVVASLIYKWGVFNNLLTSLGARTVHQIEGEKK